MSQRASGYARQERDLYETPPWCLDALKPHLRHRLRDHPIKKVWEPAAGSGKMVRALVSLGYQVEASDIATGRDFLYEPIRDDVEAIITNPPFGYAQEFITCALAHTKATRGLVAMLLDSNYDHASTRRHLFRDCPMFACCVALTRRIVWFKHPGKDPAPSSNHSWYIWDYRHKGPPIRAYGPDDGNGDNLFTV